MNNPSNVSEKSCKTSPSILKCYLESSGPYITCHYFRILSDAKAIITLHKYMGGHFTETEPCNFSTWKNKYKTIVLGEESIRANDVIEITNINSSKETQPLRIGDRILEYKGCSSDIYIIEIQYGVKYTPMTNYIVDH